MYYSGLEKTARDLGHCGPVDKKYLTPLKTLDIIFRRRYVPNTQYYFTNRKHAVEKKGSKQIASQHFHTPSSQKLISYVKHSDARRVLSRKKILQQPVHLKLNARFSVTKDLSSRLYIEEPPDDVRAVVAIHPEFYTVVEGRSLRSKDDIKVYVRNIRDYAMYRQQIGYRRDMMLRIENNMSEELAQLDDISNQMKHHIHNFQAFLTEDYKKACAKAAKAEKLRLEVHEMKVKYLSYIGYLTTLQNVIFKLDSVRTTLKQYQKYLNFVAPIAWRKKYDSNLRHSIVSIDSAGGVFTTDNDLVESLDIDKIIESAKIELRDPPPNAIYYRNPEQMMYLFRDMELQSREYLIQLQITGTPFRTIKKQIKKLKKDINEQQEYFDYLINYFQSAIDRELANMADLEQTFYRILNNAFFDSVASQDVLKLKICIDFVYTQVFGKAEEGQNQNLRDPMKILEVMYGQYNLMLDELDYKSVKEATQENFASDLKMLINAEIAQKELKAFREMTESMKRAFLPPKHYVRPVLTKFVDKKTIAAQEKAERKRIKLEKEGPSKKKYAVTPTEKEILWAFTEWCEGTDPAPYLEQYKTYVKPIFDKVDKADGPESDYPFPF